MTREIRSVSPLPEPTRPADARAAFRSGLVGTTTGRYDGWVQANLVAVPAAHAWDVLLFAQRNPRWCPVLDVLDPGAVSGPLFDGDVRTDLPAYRVHRDGELSDLPTDVRAHWRPDLVSFLLASSTSVDAALLAAGVPVRHLARGRTVPMYRTTRACRSAGRLAGNLVVVMRPVPRHLVPTAVEVTARFAYGAPVHGGDPAALGIDDLAAPDHGRPVPVAADEVPVFWACGATLTAATAASRPPLMITQEPGHRLVTDAREPGLPDVTPAWRDPRVPRAAPA